MHYINRAYTGQLDIIGKNPQQINITNRFIDNKATFSLIMPVYQESKILEEHISKFTLELRNKYNCELIVSDGGSTDDTVAIASKYADKVIIHTDNRRQTISEGRNNGAMIANSDIFVFINGDTTPVNLIEYIELITDFANQEKKYVKIGALACYVSAFPYEEQKKDKIFNIIYNNYVRLLNLIGIGMGRGECQVVRKDIFYRAGAYNNQIVAGEDFDLYRRISKIAKIKVEKKLHVYESPRRFRKYGYVRTIIYWFLNALYVMLFNKSLSKEWEAVR